MPVVIEAGTNIYKRQAAAKQAVHQTESTSLDLQTEQLEALQAAVGRVMTEMKSIRENQLQLARTVIRLRWALVAALLLSTLAIGFVLSQQF
ncbi:MAG TPA: hypothetical protein VJ692_13195 [Nitrospiraceae bacterium]|nr:hypothetical protein [Nitrospiraceae bacterium]